MSSRHVTGQTQPARPALQDSPACPRPTLAHTTAGPDSWGPCERPPQPQRTTTLPRTGASRCSYHSTRSSQWREMRKRTRRDRGHDGTSGLAVCWGQRRANYNGHLAPYVTRGSDGTQRNTTDFGLRHDGSDKKLRDEHTPPMIASSRSVCPRWSNDAAADGLTAPRGPAAGLACIA